MRNKEEAAALHMLDLVGHHQGTLAILSLSLAGSFCSFLGLFFFFFFSCSYIRFRTGFMVLPDTLK